jgi:hypothetical protein
MLGQAPHQLLNHWFLSVRVSIIKSLISVVIRNNAGCLSLPTTLQYRAAVCNQKTGL